MTKTVLNFGNSDLDIVSDFGFRASDFHCKAMISLGSSRFARRYSGNKKFFSFPPATEMFHFAEFPSRFNIGIILLNTKLGFPIRKSPGQRLLSTYPRLIAATPRPSSAPNVKVSTVHP